MAGLLRAYPVLRDISSLTREEQAHEILIAVYELHSIDHPVDKSFDWNSIRRGTLGLTALHNSTTWEPVRSFHGEAVENIRKHLTKANNDGEERSKFVRWATNQIISPRLMDKIPSSVWAYRLLREFQDVAAELQRATVEIDNQIVHKGQLRAEKIRFEALHGLLEECLTYTAEHLRANKSRIGVDELGIIANETKIIYCMKKDANLRGQYVAMRNKGEACHICFQHTASLVLKRLKDRGHPIPLDNALRIMLKVIPKLDALTLETLCVQDWYMTLIDHGMTVEAEAFDTAMENHPSVSGASILKGKRSRSVRSSTGISSASELGSIYLLPIRNYTPVQSACSSQQGSSAFDDDDGSSVSGISTVRGGAKDGPVRPVRSTVSTEKVYNWEPWMPPKNFVAWERMQGSLRPLILEHIRTKSKPATASWMGPNVNPKPTTGSRPNPQDSLSVVTDGDHLASVSEDMELTKQQPLSGAGSARSGKAAATPAESKKAIAKIGAGDNVTAVEDQTTSTKAAGKKPKFFINSPGNSTPQHHQAKPVNVAKLKQEQEQAGKQNTTATDASNNMYIIKEMSAEHQRRADSWLNVHKEYYNWDRSLVIENSIKLTLANDQRQAFLEELASAEEDGRVPFASETNDSERESACKDVCEAMWSDIRAIRKAVLTANVKIAAVYKAVRKAKERAKKQGMSPPEDADLLSMPTGRTLGEVIDLGEEDEGFEAVVDEDGDSVMSEER